MLTMTDSATTSPLDVHELQTKHDTLTATQDEARREIDRLERKLHSINHDLGAATLTMSDKVARTRERLRHERIDVEHQLEAVHETIADIDLQLPFITNALEEHAAVQLRERIDAAETELRERLRALNNKIDPLAQAVIAYRDACERVERDLTDPAAGGLLHPGAYGLRPLLSLGHVWVLANVNAASIEAWRKELREACPEL